MEQETELRDRIRREGRREGESKWEREREKEPPSAGSLGKCVGSSGTMGQGPDWGLAGVEARILQHTPETQTRGSHTGCQLIGSSFTHSTTVLAQLQTLNHQAKHLFLEK